MQVKTLIEKLQNQNPESEVMVTTPFDIYAYKVTEVGVPEDSEKVYIGCDPLFLEGWDD